MTINELINESTYAVLDSAMTEPNPEEGVGRLEYKGYPTALSLPGHRRLGWESARRGWKVVMGGCRGTYLNGVALRSLPLYYN